MWGSFSIPKSRPSGGRQVSLFRHLVAMSKCNTGEKTKRWCAKPFTTHCMGDSMWQPRGGQTSLGILTHNRHFWLETHHIEKIPKNCLYVFGVKHHKWNTCPRLIYVTLFCILVLSSHLPLTIVLLCEDLDICIQHMNHLSWLYSTSKHELLESSGLQTLFSPNYRAPNFRSPNFRSVTPAFKIFFN